jgi:hypothetical protein
MKAKSSICNKYKHILTEGCILNGCSSGLMMHHQENKYDVGG